MIFESIVARLAHEVAEQITHDAMWRIQARRSRALAGIHASANQWDEICIGLQDDFSENVYGEVLASIAEEVTITISNLERVALWLQTDRGRKFINDTPHAEFDDIVEAATIREARDYVLAKYLAPRCMAHSNEVTRSYRTFMQRVQRRARKDT